MWNAESFAEQFDGADIAQAFVAVMNGRIETVGNYPVSTRYVSAQKRIDAILNSGTNNTVTIRWLVIVPS